MTTMAEQLPGYGPPSPVQVFQWESEFSVLLDLYRERRPMRVLEVGTYHGGTLYHWLQNAQPGALVVSVDSYAVGVDNRRLYPEWVPEGVRLEVIEGNTFDPETLQQVLDISHEFDWVFIDAGHYDHEVRNDWKVFGSLCQKGGVVSFHDILPPTMAHPEIEVAFLWEELKKTHTGLEIIAERAAEWGGIGVLFV